MKKRNMLNKKTYLTTLRLSFILVGCWRCAPKGHKAKECRKKKKGGERGDEGKRRRGGRRGGRGGGTGAGKGKMVVKMGVQHFPYSLNFS